MKCKYCGQLQDTSPDGLKYNLSVDDNGTIGGLSGCGDSHDFSIFLTDKNLVEKGGLITRIDRMKLITVQISIPDEKFEPWDCHDCQWKREAFFLTEEFVEVPYRYCEIFRKSLRFDDGENHTLRCHECLSASNERYLWKHQVHGGIAPSKPFWPIILSCESCGTVLPTDGDISKYWDGIQSKWACDSCLNNLST